MFKDFENNPEDVLGDIHAIIRQAGKITLHHFSPDGYQGADIKGDNSPVTKADREAELIIEAELQKRWPDIPMVGEESAAEGRTRDISQSPYYWLVDPLDGTREFISGSGEYTVNIALIREGFPVLGAVYVPVTEELFSGYTENKTGQGHAWLQTKTDGTQKQIHVRTPPEKGLTVVASKRHGDTEKLEKFIGNFKVAELIECGSSLKICRIAAGQADLYPRFGPTCEWDTAAADAVLRAAGGFLTDEQNRPLTYTGRDPKFLNPEFIASGFSRTL